MLVRKLAVPLTIVLGLAAASPASMAAKSPPKAHAAQEADDDTVVLPSRVANAIRRTQDSLNNAEDHIDEAEYPQAIVSLRSVRDNMYRADRAARAQMNAPPPPPDAEGEDVESTAGPDSVIAVLGEEHTVVTTLAGLFDANSQGVVDGLTNAMFRTLNARDGLLNAVIALDPEGAGADFADGMADTADQYPDEVANLTEALASDTLSTGGRAVLTPALAQVTATAAAFDAAFGGGE